MSSSRVLCIDVAFQVAVESEGLSACANRTFDWLVVGPHMLAVTWSTDDR